MKKEELTLLYISNHQGDLSYISQLLSGKIDKLNLLFAQDHFKAERLVQTSTVRIDACLMNLEITSLNDLRLLRMLLFSLNDTPLIVLSQNSDPSSGKILLNMGVIDILLKEELTPTLLHKSILYGIERIKTLFALKESEQRYRNIFTLSPQPMWVYDQLNKKYRKVNEAALKLYGYTQKEFLSLRFQDLRPPEENAIATKLSKIPFGKKKSKFIGVNRHITKNNEILYVEVFVSPIYIDNREHRLVIVNDITNRLIAEKNISKRIIEAQDQERKELGAELHDNVCQLLATSQLGLNFLEDTLEINNPMFAKSMQMLNTAVNEIRSISHRLTPNPLIMQDPHSMIENLIEESHLNEFYDLEFNATEETKNILLNDKHIIQIHRVLQESIQNIGKHSFATKIIFDINLETDFLKIVVRDNGVGFESDLQKRGVGIHNMRQRIESISGKILIKSNVKEGCTIEILIPYGQK